MEPISIDSMLSMIQAWFVVDPPGRRGPTFESEWTMLRRAQHFSIGRRTEARRPGPRGAARGRPAGSTEYLSL
jgi:hypothetical protein